MNEGRNARVVEVLKDAMWRMSETGFEIRQPVNIVVDPKLPFMGYTMPQNGEFTIVISAGSIESGMLEGLLMHELSHIYRMQTNHPSHSSQLIREAASRLAGRAISQEYKQRIIRDLINDIQDLYADEIAVKVMTRTRIVSMDRLAEFFQSWVKDEVVQTSNDKRDRWVNSSIMEKNARAISQMRKQGIPDIGNRAASSNERFLKMLPAEMSRHYGYFEKLFSNISEDITEEGYREFLADYLSNFVEIAEGD
jgi:Family of unknown function (DUF5781)